MISRHETCLEYLKRRLSEGWLCIAVDGYYVTLLSPWGFRRELDIRNDVETLRPNGAGDETNLDKYPNTGDNYEKVDEASANDDTDYVYKNTDSWTRDLYAMENHSVGSGTINSVTIYFRFKTSEMLYYAYAKPVQKSNSTVTEGTEKSHKGDTNYVTESQTYTDNPATSSAYTWDEIDALQVGVSLKEEVSWQNARCTQLYIEVDYTSVVLIEREVSDSLTVGDTFTKLPSKSFSEALTLADTYIKLPWRTFAEVLTLEDSVAAVKIISTAVADVITLGDSFLKAVTKSFSEALTLADSYIKLPVKVFTDAITLGDSFLKLVAKTFTEVLTLVESIPKLVSKEFSDGLSLTECLVKGRWLRAIRCCLTALRNLPAVRNQTKIDDGLVGD